MSRNLCLFVLTVAFGSTAIVRAEDDKPANLEQLYKQVVSSIVVVTDGIEQIQGFGSGVILHKDGYIATAAHVVESADKIGIQFKSGKRTEAQIVTLSEHQDLALLKVEKIPDGMQVGRLGNSDLVKPGQGVFCIGAPRGLQFSISAGIVSAVRKHVGDRYRLHSPDDLIQTDAAVNPGNSGGALFNMRGEVVGIAVKLISAGGSANSAGLGLSVPSNLVRSRLFTDALPYFGLRLQRIPPRLAEIMNWPPFESLLIEEVHIDSFAAKAGLHGGRYRAEIAGLEVLLGGDVIYEIGEIPVRNIEKVHQHLHSLKSGDKVKYTVLRAGEISKIEVEVEKVFPIPKLPKLKPADSKPAPKTKPKAAKKKSA